jgi:hypothetical protein
MTELATPNDQGPQSLVNGDAPIHQDLIPTAIADVTVYRAVDPDAAQTFWHVVVKHQTAYMGVPETVTRDYSARVYGAADAAGDLLTMVMSGGD